MSKLTGGRETSDGKVDELENHWPKQKYHLFLHMLGMVMKPM